jgi:hypothetical protein
MVVEEDGRGMTISYESLVGKGMDALSPVSSGTAHYCSRSRKGV